MWNSIPEVLRPFVNAILIGFGGFLLAYILSRIVERALARLMRKGWSRFVGNLVAFGVGVWTIKLILDSAGAPGLVVVLVTAITGAFAIGSERFAGDLVSGVSLLVTRTYSVGDRVQLAGYEGMVANISLMTTVLETDEGDQVFIRNADATGGTVINLAPRSEHSLIVKIPVPVTQDLNEAISAVKKALKEFSPQPVVHVEAAAPGYFNIEIHVDVAKGIDRGNEETRIFLLAVNAIKKAGLTLVLVTK